MAKNKTEQTEANVREFIEAFADSEQKKKDSYTLIQLMQEATGQEPKMWGPSIIGFGSYHYKYKTGHEGDAPLLGFSPRKAALSLYVYTGLDEHRYLLDGMGKFKIGKVCIYVKKLEDIDKDKLRRLMDESLRYLRENYEIQ
ncbi:MAG TPA: DUF1801 domain-containing protein [Saprospirales bacterium]|mgnify:CR=1 FL=1|nr:DUF1801 domain-containing protein [Saprospirales bacterium]HAY71645.1 DUF1801 domain-containing protein [Saprospirales bacterium]HRQ29198.1 DUF1801 domain-containing protein [Saprospiraceae bacterium]